MQNAHKTASRLWGALSQPVGKPATPAVQPAGLLPAPGSLPGPSPGRWGRWAPAAYTVGGALIAGAAAGAAYYHRADIGTSYGTLMEHMQYVGVLWDKDALVERVRKLVEDETVQSVVFRT